MAEQVLADEKSDGLDIVSIGKLYEGPWEKKYWSSSRGKGRHPYPVGYVALRTNNGNTYKMAILEGLKGPEFVISSTDGQSCSGQTPDIAWEGFQKKSCVRIKFQRGKRFPCKIDGAELFGFKNPLVTRLLRGLKANVSQITDKSLPSLYSAETCEYPDLPVMVKVQGKERKCKKRKEIHVKSVCGANHKKGPPQDVTQSGDEHEPHFRRGFEGNHNKEIPPCLSDLDENSKHLETMACNGNNTSHSSLAEDGLQFNSSISSEHIEKQKCLSVQEESSSIGFKDHKFNEEGINLLKDQENLEVSIINRSPEFRFSKTVDEKGELPVQKDSQMLDDVGLYAPDTLDLTLDNTFNLEVEISRESNCTINDDLNSAQILVSEKFLTESHLKDEMVVVAAGSDNSEKCDSDSVEQEITDSMMTLLLPRALPLLKTFSRKKKTSNRGKKDLHEPPAKSSEQIQFEKLSSEVRIPDKPSKQNEDLSFPNTDTGSVAPGLEDSATVAPDSFDNDQCEVMESSQAELVQDAFITDQNTLGMDLCTQKGFHVSPNNQPGEEVCYIETTTSIMKSEQNVHRILQKSPERSGKVMNSYNLGNISASRKDRCTHSDTPSYEECPKLTDVKIPRLVASLSFPLYPLEVAIWTVLQGQRQSHPNETKISDEEAKDELCLNKLIKTVPNDELETIFELVGCYVHPMPISMVMLRTKGNEVFICVLCGYLMEKDRRLFIYKASIRGESRGCPSFVGHTTIISPFTRNNSDRQGLLDSSSLQFTPDGECLVLLNNIKAPYCREGSVNCRCSVCTSDCFEKNAVKVVVVKLGYVQVACKLKTTNNVCSILVCEPSYLVAAEESGRMNLWIMNSQWSAATNQSYLPTSDCMPNCIVDMKRIPNFPALIVGHTAFGDFCLWDLSRRILLSKFPAPKTSLSPFLPINLFRCPSQPFSTGSDAYRKKHVVDIMEETQRWFLETDNHGSLPVNEEEDMSLVLLVSSVSNLDSHNDNPYKDSGVNSVGCWSLALLAKGKLISENTLDQSATVAGASAGYGIIGTCDGSVYIWELSTGTKLGYLSHCQGATVSCLAGDDSGSGAFAVALDGSQLQVYAPGTSANRKT